MIQERSKVKIELFVAPDSIKSKGKFRNVSYLWSSTNLGPAGKVGYSQSSLTNIDIDCQGGVYRLQVVKYYDDYFGVKKEHVAINLEIAQAILRDSPMPWQHALPGEDEYKVIEFSCK